MVSLGNLLGSVGGNNDGGFDFASIINSGGGDSAEFGNILNVFSGGDAAGFDGGIGANALVKGFSQFGGDVDGVIPYDQAYGIGYSSGLNLLGLVGGTPLASLPSPANIDPTALFFGGDRGVLSYVGGAIEDSTSYFDEIGFGAGTIFSFATTGGAGAGTYAQLGATAGTIAAGNIDATSDAGVGIFDLDGKESRDKNGLLFTDFLSL